MKIARDNKVLRYKLSKYMHNQENEEEKNVCSKPT